MYKFKYTADVINWLLAFNSKPGLQTLDLDSQFLHLTWPEINSFVRDTENIADFFLLLLLCSVTNTRQYAMHVDKITFVSMHI